MLTDWEHPRPVVRRDMAFVKKETSMSDKPNPIDLQKHLGGLDYPAGKDDVVRKAEESGADDTVLEALRGLPDRTYEKPTDVSGAVFDK
jgi:hypothetical protein